MYIFTFIFEFIWLFVALIATIVYSSSSLDDRKYDYAFLTTILVLACAFIQFRDVEFLSMFKSNLELIALSFVGFFFIGLCVSIIRWISFNKKLSDNLQKLFNKYKDKHSKKVPAVLDDQSELYIETSAYREILKFTFTDKHSLGLDNIDVDSYRIAELYLNNSSSEWTSDLKLHFTTARNILNKILPPSFNACKNNIIFDIMFWPYLMLNFVCYDIFRICSEIVSNACSGIYNYIARKIYKGI